MILLLENVQNRINGIEKSSIKFPNYSAYIEVVLYDKKCNERLNNFLENLHDFDKYDTIIIHESIYLDDKRERLFEVLEKYAEKENKNLVKFSGYNTQSSSSNNVLTLSPTKLFENLETFLKEHKNDNSNILMLAYGKHWDINPLLNTLQELNIFIENFDENKEMDFDEFEDDFDLLELKKILKEDEYQSLFKDLNFGDEISIGDMKNLATNFKRLIEEKAND